MALKRRTILGVLAVYVVALAASHLWRAAKPAGSAGSEAGGESISIAGLENGQEVVIAFRRFCPPASGGSDAAEGDTPVVLLFHGSPGSSRDFDALGPALGGRMCALAPDLPGFGDSTKTVSDYSIAAHARAALGLLDQLNLARVHVLGFSMGGGVALELAGQAPDRVGSVTLLSAIGVQEAELLGNYHLNHAVHGAQLAALWLLQEAVPHFGVLDDVMLGVPYARNFFDSDQRPLRAILEQLEVPVLIVHGRNDPLVPAAAAFEHHRIVPQSELVLFDASHFMVFRSGEMLAEPILEFLARVEAGTATRRAGADPERLARGREPPDPTLLPRARGITLFVLMNLLALATFVSEDLASIGAGLLTAQGRIGYLAGSLACFVGIFASDVGLYLVGRFLGRPWLRRAPLRWWVSDEAVERSRAWFEEKGFSVVFASRFLPGTRVPTYVAAGVVAAPFWRFSLYLALAAAAWVPLLVGLAYLVGVRVLTYFEVFQRWAIPGAIGLAILVWMSLRLVRALGTHRGRRLLIGRWCRIRYWEFWPVWVFYLPVIAHIGWLALKYRRPTLFTAANPAMPAGGFVGESKAAILDRIAPEWVPRYRLIDDDAQDPLTEAFSFLREAGLDYPVVFKPDVGERGRGVVILRSREELETAVAGAREPFLLQEHVPGSELGVFYLREPGEERGRIFSITDKRLPEVVGDGRSTLERLILDDDRAVAMAPVYLKHLSGRADRIPEAGERVRLTDVGTHCLGAVFGDGERFKTPAFEAAVERIARPIEGFHFGRFDLKAPSPEAFARGENLRVLELNGVTSEATHIYDPRHSLRNAYATLFRQWDLAFEIGRMNRERGVKPAGVGEVLRLIWKHLLV